MQEEIWKDVVGYEGIYEISNFGRVKSVERDIEIYQNGRVKIQHQKEVIMKQMTNHCGYLTVSLRKPRKKRAKFMVHRLVATAFIPNPQNKEQVNHIDANKKNNNVSNLERNTQSENMVHARQNGLYNEITYRLARWEHAMKNSKTILLKKDGIVKKEFYCMQEACRFFDQDHKSLERWINNHYDYLGYTLEYKEKK